MEINTLKLFADIASSGSIAGAARLQNSDPSSVSRQLAGLEKQLGFRLFERTTRRLELTEAGELFLDGMAGPLDELEGLAERAREALALPSGRLRITASTTMGERWLLPALKPFQEQYPNIVLDLLLSDETLDLSRNRIDLAIRLGPAVEGDYIASRLMDTAYHVVASADWLAGNDCPAKPEQIPDHQIIAMNIGDYASQWHFRRADGEGSLSVEPTLTCTSALGVRRAALEGWGLALMANWAIAEDLESGRLVDLFPETQFSAADFNTGAWILYLSKRNMPVKTRLLIDHLKAYAK